MGSDVISFNVKDYWVILSVAWGCGYDCVCLFEYGVCMYGCRVLPEVQKVCQKVCQKA